MSQDSLGNGTPVSGSLPANSNTVEYTFSANAGDYFLGDITDLSAPNGAYATYSLHNPDGSNTPYSGVSSWIGYALTQTGSYTIVVGRSDSGFYGGTVNFSLEIALAPEPYTTPSGQSGGPLTNGQSYSSNLPLGEIDQYTLSLKAGDFIDFGISCVGGSAEMKIFNPDGSGAFEGFVSSIDSLHVTQSGDYRVLVVRGDTNSGPASYTFTIASAPEAFEPEDDGGDMMSGGSYAGNLPSWGDLDQWTFNATTGEQISLNLTYVGATGGVANFQLLRPDGSYQNAGAMTSYSGAASQTGPYQLIVFRNESGFTASNDNVSYTLGLTLDGTPSAPSPPSTELGQLASCDSCKAAPQSPGDPTSNQPHVGEPINVATGNLFEKIIDYTTAGENPLAFIRYYNSTAYVVSSPIASMLGVNWRSNYDRFIAIKSASNVLVERPDGRIVAFSLSGSTWTPNTDLDMTLVQSGSSWTFTDTDDTKETYTDVSTSAASLSSIHYRNGYTQTLTYSEGLLASVTDSYGRSLSFAYTGNLLQTVTTPDSLVLSYGLTSVTPSFGYEVGVTQSLLTSVSYNTSPATSQTYLYENTYFPFSLTGVTDENGARYSSWSYDAKGRATSSQLAGGAEYTQIAYDDSTGNRTVTNPLGQQTVYKYVVLNNVHKISEVDRIANGTVAAGTRTYGYDASGYMNQVVDWNGNLTKYTNNSHGDPTSFTEASGSSVARTTTIVYDTTWAHLPHTVTTPGLTTTLNYDTATGNLLTRVQTDTTSSAGTYTPAKRTWTYTYTATGQLHTAQMPRTDLTAKTTYAYSGGTLTSITDARSHVTTIGTSTGGGRPLKITNPNGVLTTLTYDTRNRLKTSAVTMAGGVRTTTFGYDAAENLTSVALPGGTTLTNTYDTAHRLTAVTDVYPHTANYTLDAMGHVTASSLQDGGTTDAGHTRSFDAAGRLITDTGGQGQETQYAVDGNGNPTSITDPLNHPATKQVFDALNRLSQITDRLAGVTKITYDAHDRPLTVKTPNGATTTYTYDGFGDMVVQASPDSGKMTYHYDPDGNLTSKVDALAVTANYTYDALDRRLTVSYPAASAEKVTYTYDQTGHGKGIGRLTSSTDPAGSFSRSYDERGMVTSESHSHGSHTLTTGYSYDSTGRLATITYPDGMIVTQSRNSAGDITGLSLKPTSSGTSQTILSSGHYLSFGPLNSFTFGNGIADTRTFDLDYRLNKVTDIGTATIQNLTYSLNANDNPTAITDAVHAANNQTLSYDDLDRLTSAAGSYGSQSFGYDGNGNRTKYNGTTWTYTATSNRLKTMGTTTVTANANGSVTGLSGSPTTTFNYFKSGRLSSVQSGSGTVLSYLYDGFGHKVTGTDTAQRFYQYDQSGNMIEMTDNTDTVKLDYIYLNGLPVATFVPNGSTGTLSFLHTDRLGSPRVATSSKQAIGWTGEYQPFGTAAVTVGTIANNLRLPGQQYEQATGQHYNGMRDYIPGWGRYLESDPIGLISGINTYAYVSNNPFKWTDRKGLDKQALTYTGDPDLPLGHPLPELAVAALLGVGEVPAIADAIWGALIDAIVPDAIAPEDQPAQGSVCKINPGKQGKHIPGDNNYVPGRSFLTANPEVLAEKAGTGDPANSLLRGEAGFKERVDFGEVIGQYVDQNGNATPTTKGMIVYDKAGTIHIYPVRP